MSDTLIIYKDPAQTEVASVIHLNDKIETKEKSSITGNLSGRKVQQLDENTANIPVGKIMDLSSQKIS